MRPEVINSELGASHTCMGDRNEYQHTCGRLGQLETTYRRCNVHYLGAILYHEAQVRERFRDNDRRRAYPSPDINDHSVLRELLPRESLVGTNESVSSLSLREGQERTSQYVFCCLPTPRASHRTPEVRETELVLREFQPVEVAALRGEGGVEGCIVAGGVGHAMLSPKGAERRRTGPVGE